MFSFNLVQTRGRFKPCISLCTKELGTWFVRLLEVLKTMANAQPGQSFEPSARNNEGDDDDDTSDDTEASSSRWQYVPVREPNKRARLDRGVDDMTKTNRHNETNIIKRHRSAELIQLLKDESARQARRDEQFYQMMMGQIYPYGTNLMMLLSNVLSALTKFWRKVPMDLFEDLFENLFKNIFVRIKRILCKGLENADMNTM